MKKFVLSVLLFLLILTPVFAGTNESLQLAETNLILLCASKSDVTAYVKVSSIAFVRKPTDPTVIDLTVYGRLFRLHVKRVYLHENAAAAFPTNIYVYSGGAIELNFLEPTIQVGREYIVFLKREDVPDIVNSGTATDPVLPGTNYFSFVQLPERQMPNRKACMEIEDTNSLTSVERFLSKSLFTVPEAVLVP